MHFNLFDIIILSIFVGSTLLGMYRGLIVSCINIGNFIFTILLTILLTPLSEEIVQEHIKNDLITTIVSVVISYLLSNFASNWLSKRLKEIAEKYSLGFVDKILGVWIGAIRGYIVAVALFATIASITSSSYVGAQNYWQLIQNIDSQKYPKWLKNAALYGVMNGSFNFLYNTSSHSFIERYLENISMPSHQVKKGLENEKSMQKEEEIQSINPNLDSVDKLQEELLKTY